jgi:hypothetical protein
LDVSVFEEPLSSFVHPLSRDFVVVRFSSMVLVMTSNRQIGASRYSRCE